MEDVSPKHVRQHESNVICQDGKDSIAHDQSQKLDRKEVKACPDTMRAWAIHNGVWAS
jgi:hypothetical protein